MNPFGSRTSPAKCLHVPSHLGVLCAGAVAACLSGWLTAPPGAPVWPSMGSPDRPPVEIERAGQHGFPAPGSDNEMRTVYDAERFTVFPEQGDEQPPNPPRVGGEKCEDATVIAALPYMDTSTTVGRQNNYDASGVFTCPYTSTARDVVYKFTPTADQVLTITTVCGGTGTLDSKVYAYGGTGTPTEVCVTDNIKQCDDDFCGSPGWHSMIRGLVVQPGLDYYIVVDGWSTSQGTYTLEVGELQPGSCCDATVQPDACSNGVAFLDCAGLGYKWVESGDCTSPMACCTTPVPQVDQKPACPSNHLWGLGWDEGADFYTIYGADVDWPEERVDGFWEVNQPIQFVSWWGMYTDSWTAPCAKADLWSVTLYNNDHGSPGTVAYGPYTLTPQCTGTGWYFEPFSELCRFTAELQVAVSMTEGWVGLQAQTDPANPTCRGVVMGSAEEASGDQLHYTLPAPPQRQDNDLAICLSAAGVPGSCCDEDTLVCNENVDPALCTSPRRRFVEGGFCVNFDPPCGYGACCRTVGPCDMALSRYCRTPHVWHNDRTCAADCNSNGYTDFCEVGTGISPDCNTDLVPDDCDLTTGTSRDCNMNQTPDECEPDCNANDTPDDCDFAGGTSADCNANGLPDECEMGAGRRVYVISDHGQSSGQETIQVYEIRGASLSLVTEHLIPSFGAGPLDVTEDLSTYTLFVIYSNSNIIVVVDAPTFTSLGTVAATGEYGLTGIAFDRSQQRLYAVAYSYPGPHKLYVYDWDGATRVLTADPSNPHWLQGSGVLAAGIALDESAGLLYASSRSSTVWVYDTSTWALADTVSLSASARDVGVDSVRGFLYAGDWYPHSLLIQYDLLTGTQLGADVSPGGVMGIAVDENTGLVYITTGREEGDGVQVWDFGVSPPARRCQTRDIGDPTGLCIGSLPGVLPGDCNSNGTLDECETLAEGDFDVDGDVDLDDFQAFVECLAGPQVPPNPPAPECVNACLGAFDLDADGDVDLGDFGAFQAVFGRCAASHGMGVFRCPGSVYANDGGRLMRKERKNCTAAQRMAILREPFSEKVTMSPLCERHPLRLTLCDTWPKTLFENGAALFEAGHGSSRRPARIMGHTNTKPPRRSIQISYEMIGSTPGNARTTFKPAVTLIPASLGGLGSSWP